VWLRKAGTGKNVHTSFCSIAVSKMYLCECSCESGTSGSSHDPARQFSLPNDTCVGPSTEGKARQTRVGSNLGSVEASEA
jgi:hypothetical protein